MNTFWIGAMAGIAGLIPGHLFDRVKAAVERWDDKVEQGKPLEKEE